MPQKSKTHIPLFTKHLHAHKKSVVKKKLLKKVTIGEPDYFINYLPDFSPNNGLLVTEITTTVAVTAVSDKGKLFIKSWEQGPGGSGQPALTVYDDADKKYKNELKNLSGRPKGYWTIGYGHLLLAGENYDKGISLPEAERLFEYDLKKKSVNTINKYVTAALNQHQFDALASYVFNTGSLKGTKLLANINKKDFKAASLEMDIITSGGKVMKGLIIRRKNEQNMWTNAVYENHR
ncbi:MAG: lysozyme [Ferruginibacter sp.]